jgi:uncharacterized membrane protein YraQ (UPF0718 family)
MQWVAIAMWLGALTLIGTAMRRRDGTTRRGFSQSVEYLVMMAPRMGVATLLASFAAELIPGDLVSGWLGENSGFTGILIASVSGIFVPAGGVIAFPLALAMLKVGVGLPQLVAFLTSWEVFAIHRVLAFELPMMGTNFVALRITASFMMPPVAGIAAAGLMQVMPV